MNTLRTTLYKDRQNGKLMGVCAGVADYTGVEILWVRLLLVLAILMPGPNAVIIMAYIAAGILLKDKPTHLYTDRQEQKYWQGVRQSPKRTAREIRARMKDVDRRLADVETFYVSSNPRLSAEIERLR